MAGAWHQGHPRSGRSRPRPCRRQQGSEPWCRICLDEETWLSDARGRPAPPPARLPRVRAGSRAGRGGSRRLLVAALGEAGWKRKWTGLPRPHAHAGGRGPRLPSGQARPPLGLRLPGSRPRGGAAARAPGRPRHPSPRLSPAVFRVCQDRAAAGAARGGPPPEEGGHPEPGQLLPRAHRGAEGQSSEGPVQLRPPG